MKITKFGYLLSLVALLITAIPASSMEIKTFPSSNKEAIELPNVISSLTWSYDGKKVYTTCKDMNVLRLFEATQDGLQLLKEYPITHPIAQLAQSCSNKCLALGLTGGIIAIINEENLKLKDTHSFTNCIIQGLNWIEKTPYLLVCTQNKTSHEIIFHVYNSDTKKIDKQIPFKGNIVNITLSPSGKYIAIAENLAPIKIPDFTSLDVPFENGSYRVSLFNLENLTPKLIEHYELESTFVDCAWSTQSDALSILTDDGHLRVLNSNGKLVKDFHDERLERTRGTMSWSPTGLIAAPANLRTVLIFNPLEKNPYIKEVYIGDVSKKFLFASRITWHPQNSYLVVSHGNVATEGGAKNISLHNTNN